MTVTCHTPGCDNEGIPLVIADTWTDLDGTHHPVTVVQCGVCQQWIMPPTEPTEDVSPEPDSEEASDE